MNFASTPGTAPLNTRTDTADLIERHRSTLESMGPLVQVRMPASVARQGGARRVYVLNSAQTAFVTAALKAESAASRTA